MVLHELGGTFVVRLRWRPRDGAPDREQYQVVRVDRDLVREMRDYRTEPEAVRAAKRLAATKAP